MQTTKLLLVEPGNLQELEVLLLEVLLLLLLVEPGVLLELRQNQEDQ